MKIKDVKVMESIKEGKSIFKRRECLVGGPAPEDATFRHQPDPQPTTHGEGSRDPFRAAP
jgi:hypothetical protein